MTVLIDTCVLVWMLVDPARLSKRSREVLSLTEISIVVSAASLWEIAMKVRKGTWPEAAKVEGQILEGMRAANFRILAIDGMTALRAGRLPGAHSDPFDRMLAAHCVAEDISFISPDAKIDEFGVRRIW